MRLIAENLRYPEGPLVLPDGSIACVEIARGTLSRILSDGRTEVVADLGGGPNGAAVGPDGLVYVCNNGGLEFITESGLTRTGHQPPGYRGGRIEVVDPATGRFERLYDRFEDRPLNGPNDLVLDGKGGIWFTDLGKQRDHDRDHGAVYWARLDGSEIKQVIKPILTPNGIGLSPDGRTLYVAETETARLWAWEIVEPGVVRKAPWPSPHGGWLAGAASDCYAKFDSLAVTASGKVCVGTLIHGGISEIDPATGSVRHHPVMDYLTTNLCFADKDLTTAYVTLSSTGRMVAMEWSEPGLRLHHTEGCQS